MLFLFLMKGAFDEPTHSTLLAPDFEPWVFTIVAGDSCIGREKETKKEKKIRIWRDKKLVLANERISAQSK